MGKVVIIVAIIGEEGGKGAGGRGKDGKMKCFVSNQVCF